MSAAPSDDASKLLAKVIDKVDRVLFEHDLEFRNSADWEEFADKVRALVHEYYDDCADNAADPDFDPDAPDESSSSESESLQGTDEQCESDSRKLKVHA